MRRTIWFSSAILKVSRFHRQNLVEDLPACRRIVPSNPGQNLHLVSSQIHAVASSSHLANSSSQLVVLSSYLVESSSHLVVLSILLTSPLLVYSSVILQLVVSPFNSSCRTSTRRSLYPYILSYSSRTLHADPIELSRSATRYVMFCLYSGPLILSIDIWN